MVNDEEDILEGVVKIDDQSRINMKNDNEIRMKNEENEKAEDDDEKMTGARNEKEIMVVKDGKDILEKRKEEREGDSANGAKAKTDQSMLTQSRIVGKGGVIGISVKGRKIGTKQAKGRRTKKVLPDGDQSTLGRQTKIFELFNKIDRK